MKKLTNYLIKFYTLAPIGLIMLLCLLWAQYLRPRLPRDIPFQLSVFSLVLLIYTCLIFRPKPSKFILYLYPYLAPYHQLIVKPLAVLDIAVRNTTLIKAIMRFIAKLLPYITFLDSNFILWIHFASHFIPRLLLLLFFILDIFYFKKLALMYLFIWLGFIPLFISYIIYSLKQTLEDYILYLEPLYKAYVIPQNKEQQEEWNTLNNVECAYKDYAKPIREFIFYKTMTYEEYKYAPIPTWDAVDKHYTYQEMSDRCYGDKEEMPKDMKEVVERDFYELMPLILNIYLFTNDYRITINEYTKLNKSYKASEATHPFTLTNLNIGIYSVYLICWIYILVISISTFTLSDMDVIYLESFQDNLNPFALDLPMSSAQKKG
jgi:hypothetical protein